MKSDQLQLNADGQLQHFLTLEGLPQSLLLNILDTADSFIGVGERNIKNVPLLRGKTVVNLFFEPSTRTRTTFELAAKRLSADVLNININQSATSKGESLLDMLQNLEAMASDMFVVRHAQSGATHFIAQLLKPGSAVVNAGDGWHSHPTQAMLDMLTIRQKKGSFDSLKVAIVGDIQHSRVARSQVRALKTLGAAEIRLVGPQTLVPPSLESLGVKVYNDITKGISDVDVVIMLRLQKERMSGTLLPSEREYFRCYGLDKVKLAHAKADAIVMHPGPINRGVEIASDVADGGQSVILDQVTNGIAVRMAVMSMVMSGQTQSKMAGAL